MTRISIDRIMSEIDKTYHVWTVNTDRSEDNEKFSEMVLSIVKDKVLVALGAELPRMRDRAALAVSLLSDIFRQLTYEEFSQMLANAPQAAQLGSIPSPAADLDDLQVPKGRNFRTEEDAKAIVAVIEKAIANEFKAQGVVMAQPRIR